MIINDKYIDDKIVKYAATKLVKALPKHLADNPALFEVFAKAYKAEMAYKNAGGN